MNRAKICGFILLAALVAVCVTGGIQATAGHDPEAYAASIFDKLTPEIIKTYETEIAGAPVVSDKSSAMLERTANSLKISTNKLKTIMLLQDLAARVGEEISLSALADMSDIELFIYAKDKGTTYANSLSPERREQLKTLLLNALKS